MQLKYFFLILLVSLKVHATEPQDSGTPAKVIISGAKTDLDASRDFIAGKIVIGKKTISESGVQNVGEILRREPAITLGKDGRIGLLGLPGYTQILVDGAPPSSIDPLTLDTIQVERIEIIKSATAATGPYGIAGTVNIVRRAVERTAFTQLRAGSSLSDRKLGANFAMTSNQLPSNSPLSYNYSLVIDGKASPSQQIYEQERSSADGSVVKLFDGDRESTSRNQNVVANLDVALKLSSDHKFSLSADGGRVAIKQVSDERRTWLNGESLATHVNEKGPLTSFAMNARWDWTIDADSRLSAKVHTNRTQVDSASLRLENWEQEADNIRRHGYRQSMASNLLDINFSTEFHGGHEFSAGTKLSRLRSKKRYEDYVNDVPDLSQTVLGDHDSWNQDWMRFFVQDDWRVDRSLSIGIGISAENRRQILNEVGESRSGRFNMWSPSLHIAKKIGGDRKRQLRVSIAQTYLAPTPDQMLLHPTINKFAPCIAGNLCGSNSPDTADSSGNPSLLPERAVGLNASYTHGFGLNSEAVFELYSRDIYNKIESELALQDVPWATVPRYVYRSTNMGNARVRGISLETRISARDIWKGAPALDIVGSLGLARSTVSNIPGPDNHLSGQLPWRAKLGLTYAVKELPLKVNFDANWLPPDWLRESKIERSYQSRKATFNTGLNWKLDASSRIVLALDNLQFAKNYRLNEYNASDSMLRRKTKNENFTRATIRFEKSL